MSIATLGQFIVHPASGIKVHPEYGKFEYSDGERNELRVLDILKTVSDLSIGSGELASHIDDWVTEYHFSGTRVNLLRHIKLAPVHRVLELGAGCGSITRFLGESGASITAVEGSLTRAQCARARCRDLENVSIFCSNFQDIEFEPVYDVVTLIGVMEYSPKFFEGDDPIGSCLAVARKALRPGGILLLAIENQLGFKYFAGATEDHLGDHYAGVEGRYPPRNVVTFGQKALRKHVSRAGFDEIEFQFPFPDYKIPTVILFQQGLDDPEFLPDELIRHLDERDYSGKHKHEIDSAMVWPQLAENGLIGEFSNSFLVVACLPQGSSGNGAGAIGLSEPGCLGLAYASARAAPFQTVTRFERVDSGKVVVSKFRLREELPTPDGPLNLSLVRDAYRCGRTLHSRIYERLKVGDLPGFMDCLRLWMDYLSRFKAVETDSRWDTEINGVAFDCLPTNLVISGDQLTYIDQEWSTTNPLQLSTIVLRYMFNLAFSSPSDVLFLERFGPEPIKSIKSISAELGVVLNSDSVTQFFELNQAVHHQVFPNKPAIPEYLKSEFDEAAPVPVPVPVPIGDSPSSKEVPTAVDSLKNVIRKILG